MDKNITMKKTLDTILKFAQDDFNVVCKDIIYPGGTIFTPIWANQNIESLPNEKWENIKGHPEYLISNYSRVKSLPKKGNSYKEIILKQYFNHWGYIYVSLKSKKIALHRIMATSFIENKLNKAQVNHKNGRKWDNRISNLEWNTALENQMHAIRTKLKLHKKGGEVHNAIAVNQYSLNGDFIKKWDCISDIEKTLDFNASPISKCCKLNINYNQAYGFIWRFNSTNPYHISLDMSNIKIKYKPKFEKRRQTTINNKKNDKTNTSST